VEKELYSDMKLKAAVVGGTGMVGQRFIAMLKDHPWFEVTAIAASANSAGKSYEEAVSGRWKLALPLPESVKRIKVQDASRVDDVASDVDLIFCAVDMKKEEIRALEEAYARTGTPVISNNSAHRWTPDVPMVIPEVNPGHIEVIAFQRKRLGTKTGFIAVKPNCSIQSYVPALHAVMEYKPLKIVACTYQAISGAGKTFQDWPEMVDNVIPYIGGEEEKSEQEPLRIWGTISDGTIVKATSPLITSQCIRVPVTDGHLAAVFATFENKPSKDEILERWRSFRGRPQELGLPSAPKQFIQYFEAPDRPQTKLDRDIENGMSIAAGRLREDALYDYKFVSLSHNTVRGAAGGGVLIAELLKADGYISKK
jgi:aspartate-semialdehyde dehydrogenase